jgi:hypothetical protein
VYLKILEQGGFRVIEVASASFRRLEEPCVLYRVKGEDEEKKLVLTGNAFLLNSEGDTFETFRFEPKQTLRKVGTS